MCCDSRKPDCDEAHPDEPRPFPSPNGTTVTTPGISNKVAYTLQVDADVLDELEEMARLLHMQSSDLALRILVDGLAELAGHRCRSVDDYLNATRAYFDHAIDRLKIAAKTLENPDRIETV